MKLLFFSSEEMFYDENGVLREEPEFIEDTKRNYAHRNGGVSFAEIRSGGQTGVDEAGIKAAQYHGIHCSILAPKGFRMHYEEGVELEGRKQFTDRFREQYIDMEAWQKDEESFSWGLADFNGFNAIDMLEFEIDLKIMHINARE